MILRIEDYSSPAVARDHAPAVKDLAHKLSGHGLWLRGGEWNTLPLEDYENRPLKVLIARMSTYADTSESFTHTLLYQALASLPEVYPDMAYLPPPRDGSLLSRAGLPWLLGTQSKRGPEGFHVVALSNAIVQELVNLPAILRNSGLLLPREERLKRPDLPLLLLGGANVFHASLVDHEESPIDGMFVGENIEDIQSLMTLCLRGQSEGWSKVELLGQLESVPGFAQPGSGKPSRKRNTETMDLRRLTARRPALYKLSGLGQEPVALSRGCPAFCSFCAESFDLKPYRENPQEVVVQNALRLKREMGLEAIDLFSFNFNFYEDLYPLLERLGTLFNGIGLKSQRFDMIAKDPGMLGYLRAVGKASFTFGMEGVSARLRRYLQKGLEEGDLWKALQAVFRHQVRELKVFMIATGLEEEEDFLEFSDFLQRLPDVMRASTYPPKITFSATPLVRFPWTPLEFAAAPPPEKYRGIARRLGSIVERAGFQWREAAEEADNYVSQILVRADRKTYWEAVQAAVQETGFLFYRDMSDKFMVTLRRILAERGLGDDITLAGGDLAAHAHKPWVRHDTGVRRNFLWLQYKRASRYEDKGYCLGTTEKEGTCLACDSCETEEDTLGLVHQRTQHEIDAEAFSDALKARKKRAVQIGLDMVWSAAAAGLPRKYVALVTASAIMRVAPGLTEGFWRYHSCWAAAEGDKCHVFGEDRLILEWQPEAAEKLEILLEDPIFLAEVNAVLSGWGKVAGRSPTLEASPLPLQPRLWIFTSPYEPQLQGYAKVKSLPFTQSRRGSGWEATFSKDALKKKLIQKAYWGKKEKMENTDPPENIAAMHSPQVLWELKIHPLEKFQVETFLREAFSLPHERAWSDIQVQAEGLGQRAS